MAPYDGGYGRGFMWSRHMDGGETWGGRGFDRPPPPRGDGGDGRGRWNRVAYGRDYDGPHPSGGGFGGGPGHPPRRGYDGEGFAGSPFLPADAYRRHPELERGGHQSAPWGDRAYGRHGRATDEDVARAVRDRLYRDSWLDAEGLQVEVSDGVVTLSGQVADFMEARYAWDDAWETDGVRGVVNNLTVRLDGTGHGDPLPQDGDAGG